MHLNWGIRPRLNFYQNIFLFFFIKYNYIMICNDMELLSTPKGDYSHIYLYFILLAIFNYNV